MKNMIIPALSIAIAFAACQSASTQQPATNTADSIGNTDTSTSTSAGIPLLQCYIQVVGKDTSLLSLSIDQKQVSGKLEYIHFEKDRNSGTFNGTIDGNIIRADYEFMSEGTTSTRKVVFKKENNQLFEAIANSIDKDGLPVYAEKTTELKFTKEPFTATDCK